MERDLYYEEWLDAINEKFHDAEEMDRWLTEFYAGREEEEDES